MPKNLDLLDMSVVTRIITEMDKSEDRDRRKHSFDSWQVYSGNVRAYVEQELVRTRPNSWHGYTISESSLSKMIVDTVAKSYKQQPIRMIDDDDTKNERLSDIYREADAMRQLPFFDTTTTLHKYSLIWVNYREDDDRYQFMTLQPHEFSVVRDKDTGELLAVILNYGNRDITDGSMSGDGIDDLIAESQSDSSAQTTVYAMWSKDNYVVVERELEKVVTPMGEQYKPSITYVEIPNNPENINVLGRIPFVFLSKELSPDYPTKSPLFSQTVTSNSLLSEYLTSSNIQGTGQLVFSYPEKFENSFKKITTGLLSALKLPQSTNPEDKPTTAEYINPSPDLSGQKEAVETFITSVLKENGITNASALTNDGQIASSGIARAISNANVDDIIAKNQELYTSVEKEMFEIIKAWEAFKGPSVFKEDDELQITFRKPKVLISDKEVLDNIEQRLRLGLIEKWEALKILDPNLSDEEAQEKLERIAMSKALSVAKAFNGNIVEEDSEDDPAGLEQRSK